MEYESQFFLIIRAMGCLAEICVVNHGPAEESSDYKAGPFVCGGYIMLIST